MLNKVNMDVTVNINTLCANITNCGRIGFESLRVGLGLSHLFIQHYHNPPFHKWMSHN